MTEGFAHPCSQVALLYSFESLCSAVPCLLRSVPRSLSRFLLCSFLPLPRPPSCPLSILDHRCFCLSVSFYFCLGFFLFILYPPPFASPPPFQSHPSISCALGESLNKNLLLTQGCLYGIPERWTPVLLIPPMSAGAKGTFDGFHYREPRESMGIYTRM